ncbi:uncharacterized protein PAC_14161 [Phialocephala subalpina]|uniref:Uncharacterized protein n=1 Tax=Phialocephala subalpina TaxID=576137 RepID=A0A1L7XGU2_9HELO|nr:uncharacterized protein PAC_14161 [Phialocephala subalpina]
MPFGYSLRSLIGRQSSTEILAVCYTSCNNCYIEAQRIGLVCPLCHTTQNATSVYTLTELDPFVNYCKGAAVQASADAIFSSFAASVTITKSVYVTVGGSSTGSSTSSPDTFSSKHRNYAWIAGLLVGILILLAAIGVALFYLRKRRKAKELAEAEVGTDPDKKEPDVQDKAQLHAESMAVLRHELGTGTEPRTISELPALELVGSELQGRWLGPDRPDDRSN